MSTILIDRRTAALLGELAAAPVPARARTLGRPAVDGVALGVAVTAPAGRAPRRGAAPVVPAVPVPTRRSAHRSAEKSRQRGEVTVRRQSAAEARLRRRLRCEPTSGPAAGRPGRSIATLGGRPVRRRRGALHLTRRGRAVALLLLLVVLTVAFSVGRVTSTALGTGTGPGPEVVVQRGDTLWSIAERIAPNADPRTTAADLMAVNGLASPSLEIGQHLRLP